MNNPLPMILASASPRRRELLAKMGVPFEVVTADVPELDGASGSHLTAAELAKENARAKAESVAHQDAGRFVLGADTIVTLEGRIFGKPASQNHARQFLQVLSGRTHEVITGCALFAPGESPEVFHDVTRVTFRALDPDLIERYLAAVHVLDKAGAYALQEHGEWIIERVEGSRANVIGLPVERLEEVFHRRGLV